MFRVIIAGGRDYNDYNELKRICDHMLQNQSDITIVSGKARGADTLGEWYAKERGYPIQEHPANWDKYKKKAGSIRNEEMAQNADALIAFWDGESYGTGHMIKIAKQYNLKVKTHIYLTNHN